MWIDPEVPDKSTYPHATNPPDGAYVQAITHVVGIETACSLLFV